MLEKGIELLRVENLLPSVILLIAIRSTLEKGLEPLKGRKFSTPSIPS
jgi:hypothetical protein